MKILLQSAAVALLSVGLMASCNSDENAAVRDAARASVTATPTATGADGTQLQQLPESQVSMQPAGPTTNMTFTETTFDYGTISEGDKVSHTYTFTNSGDEPLVISSAKGSCGCTVPKWPREPIAPGATGEILVEFNSKGKTGNQSKTVTLVANTEPAQSVLTIKGVVEKGQGEAALLN